MNKLYYNLGEIKHSSNVCLRGFTLKMIFNRFLLLTCLLIFIHSTEACGLFKSVFEKFKSTFSTTKNYPEKAYTKVTCVENDVSGSNSQGSASDAIALNIGEPGLKWIINPNSHKIIFKCVHHDYEGWKEHIGSIEPTWIGSTPNNVIETGTSAFTCFEETMAIPYYQFNKFYYHAENKKMWIPGTSSMGGKMITVENKNVLGITLIRRWQQDLATAKPIKFSHNNGENEHEIVKTLSEKPPPLKTLFKQIEDPNKIMDLKKKLISTKIPSQVPETNFEVSNIDERLPGRVSRNAPTITGVKDWKNGEAPIKIGKSDYGDYLLIGTKIHSEIGDPTHTSTCVFVPTMKTLEEQQLCQVFHLEEIAQQKQNPTDHFSNYFSKLETPTYKTATYTCFNWDLGVPFLKVFKYYRGETAMHSIVFTHEQFSIKINENPSYVWRMKDERDKLIRMTLFRNHNRGYRTIDFTEVTYREYGKPNVPVIYRGKVSYLEEKQDEFDESCEDILQ